MKTIVRCTLLVFLIGLAMNLLGQSSDLAIDENRKVWVGINTGAIWQHSDVKARLGVGYGLTLDYYFIRDNTSMFGIGVRGQFLQANSRGLGLTRDFGIQNNTSLNGSSGNPDYASLPAPDNYVFQNHSTNITDLSGNIIISLNRLRSISRLNLYVFGGFGGTGYFTKMDQRDAAKNLYDYTALDIGFSNSFTKKHLKDLLDGTYETYGESGSNRRWTVTPTIGAGFGIQLSSRVQIGIEHKVGFTGTDLLDGNQWNATNIKDTKNDFPIPIFTLKEE